MALKCKKKQLQSEKKQRAAPILIGARWVCFALIIFFWTWGISNNDGSVSAQDLAELEVGTPEIGGFPTSSLEFKLTGVDAETIHTLSVEDLAVIENEQALQPTSLDQMYRGVLFSLTVNANRELDLRDSEGLSRYDTLSASLDSWASSRNFSSNDMWSFVTNDGVAVRAAGSAAEWTAGLSAYQPDFRALEPELFGLETALQALDERVVSLGVDKVLLYITPPPEADQIEDLLRLAEDARSAGIRVNVWMVGDEYYLLNDQGGALMNLAVVTGGQFFRYTGVEPIPNPADYLSSLGYVHTITYETGIRETGTYPLQIEVSLADMQLRSDSQTFYIDVQPPKPILISPPAQISIQHSSEKSGSLALTPEVYEWQIMVEFPDEKVREIAVTRLYVDGQVVDVNREAPFDSFAWDLSELRESGEHIVQVEVEDTLGLSSRTLLTPVQVEVLQPGEKTRLTLQQGGLISAAVILAASFVIFMVWLVRRLLGQKKHPDINLHLFRKRKIAVAEQNKMMIDKSSIIAFLSPLNGVGSDSIRIVHNTVTLGGDASQVDCVIDDEEVSSVHARLNLKGEEFWLQDLNSDTGTWVNYVDIGKRRVQIHPGDLIHFGSTGFRFTIESGHTHANVTVSKCESLL